MTNHDQNTDVVFMRRALELAALGRGSVSPNPMVGCVITRDGLIVGEGWHQRYGASHAEVNAVNTVADQSILSECTVYVNLEPCAHWGKTPPCADLLVLKKVKRVVIANTDSNPLVGGKGIQKLMAAGIAVTTGILEAEGRVLNRRFFTVMESRRPYIILKWAQTADGFIARENFDSKWISNDFSRRLVHRWRTEEDAVLVGTQTAHYDDPQLNVRLWSGRDPIRIVLDRFGKLPAHLRLFDGSQKTICYSTVQKEERPNVSMVRLPVDGFPEAVINDMFHQKIQSVIVEGGAGTLKMFMDASLWDEARIFTSPGTFGNGIPAPAISGTHTTTENIGDDTLGTVYRIA